MRVIAVMSDFVLVGGTYTAAFGQAVIVPDGSHSVALCFALVTATSVSSEQIDIGCDIFDELSGVESSSCQSVSAPAYGFAAGDYAVSASASDYAGNGASASGTFTAVVTADSPSNVVSDFVDNHFVGASMTSSHCGCGEPSPACAPRELSNAHASAIGLKLHGP